MSPKICHLTSVHSLLDNRIFFKECMGLASNGFSVSLIAFGDESFEEIRDCVRLISLNVPVKNRLQRLIKRSKAVYQRALQENADIYHFHDPELLPVGLRLKKKGKKVVYDSHEDLPRQIFHKEYIPVFIKNQISMIVEPIENYYVRRLDAVITVTDHIAKRFSKIAKKVIVCANYASLKEFDVVTEWGNNRDSICYVGGISKLRGILELIDASKKVGVSLELAGRFESKSLENQIIKVENVNYNGFVNRNEIKPILSHCFAGVITFLPAPNHNFACPNKLFEYMASGIPVIASNFKDWKPIVEGNNAGLCVDPKNIESISNAILYLKNNPKIAQQMGQNGRNAFEVNYNWQIEEKKLFTLYNELN